MIRILKSRQLALAILSLALTAFLSLDIFAAGQSFGKGSNKREVITKRKLTAKDKSVADKTAPMAYSMMSMRVAEPTFRYIIQGSERSVVSALARNGEFDINSSESKSYLVDLEAAQLKLLQRIEATLGREVAKVDNFKTALNAVVVDLTETEAEKLASLTGILKIQKDELRQLHKESSSLQGFAQPENKSVWLWLMFAFSLATVLTAWILIRGKVVSRRVGLLSSFFLISGFVLFGCHEGGYVWIGAPQIWKGVDNLPGTMGEGIVVGIIDSGINPISDSFAATGDDGYTHTNPKGKYFGVCDPAEAVYDPSFPCNDKLIGAWGFPLIEGGNPRDVDGHGSHTAGTTAGNIVYKATVVTPNGKEMSKTIAGVAPHANVIAYTVCGDVGCYLSAILGAIDQAIVDGVDVINYSIGGGSSDPWADLDSIAFLNAMYAGIFVATSAGNDGPGAATLGSPGDAPWITTVAASSHNIHYENYLIGLSGGDTTPPFLIKGHSVTVGFGPAPIVDAADYGNAACVPGEFNAAFNGEIVLCNHANETARYIKGQAVLDNGGGAMILNIIPTSPDGVGYFMTDSHVLPATHILNTDAEVLRTWLSSGTGHQGKLSGTVKVRNDNEADILAYFSSRGQNPAVPSIVKPNITAPGRAIFAAYHEAFSDATQDYNIIRGTSMSSPHIAGSGALLKSLHPDWTPMEIQSAMMTTATLFEHKKEDGVTPVDPFDVGAGRIDLPLAATAGLILNETAINFVNQDPFFGGDPSTLNLASLGQSSCVVECSWTRTVENISSVTTIWENQPVAGLTVTPTVFSLNPGDTQTITVTLDVLTATIGEWQFKEVSFVEMNGQAPDFHLPLAALPTNSNFPAIVDVAATAEVGTHTMTGLKAIEIAGSVVNKAGLVQGDKTINALVSDPSNGDPFDAYGDPAVDGAFFYIVSVPAGAERLVAQITASASGDLDLFVGSGTTPGFGTLIAYGATGGFAEYVNINNPPAGDYWILVQNWEGGHTTPQAMEMFHAVVAGDEGNMTIVAPSSQPAGVLFDIDINYDLTGSSTGDRFYGLFDMGSGAGSPGDLGTVLIDLVRQ